FVEQRFGVGSVLWVRSASGERAMTIASSRVQGERPIVQFEGFDNIEAVKQLAGLELRVPEEDLPELGAGTFYHHELVGCRVETVDGRPVGNVAAVEGGPGGSRLVITGHRGDVLVPLANDICVEIDVEAKR